MASAIDATKPVAGSPTTQSVRDNFATAASEITALQATAVTTPVTVANGGTGSTSAAGALTNLGAAPIVSPVFSGDVTAGGASSVGTDLVLARVDQATGFIVRPNSAGHKALAFAVAGAGPLDSITLNATATSVTGTLALGSTGNVTMTSTTGGFTAINAPDGTGNTLVGGSAQGNITYNRNAAEYFQNLAGSTTYAQFSSGGTYNVSGAWQVISAREMKENIAPYTRGLDAVVQLNPVQFRYAAGTPFASADEPSKPLFGLMADEVRPVVPEIVSQTTGTVGGKEDVPIDTLEPGNLIYTLINAIKELKAEIDTLKAGSA
jgi:hypothetical protein